MTPAELVDAREFVFCQAIYQDPDRLIVSHKLVVVGTGLNSNGADIGRAACVERWGEPYKFYTYPRTYVREARSLVERGLYVEAVTR